MTLRVLIVDDEAAARRRLASLIEEIDARGIEIVGEAADGVDALARARERAPDVVLLDIEMREVDGFDVARHLPEPRPLVIFQTAHHRYAVEAFEQAALDFVVKPVSRDRLARALERARDRLAERRDWPPPGAEAFERVSAALGYRPAAPARLLVRHGAGHRLVPIISIGRFTAADGVVYAYAGADASICDYTITELEGRLGAAFVRASRADLVQTTWIDRVLGNGDGSLTLTLRDGVTVHVSRRRAADVRARLAP